MKTDKWIICPGCRGEGTCVNPNIDAHGLTREDFDEDPDFADDYFSGRYDVSCGACGGSGKIKQSHQRTLARNAADRRLAAQEDGDWEGASVASDWRFG